MTHEMIECIERCVLCWLATVDEQGVPNVSPKEMFLSIGADALLIANIASPNTVRNILNNPNVCVSMVDVFVQKGYKLKGTASIHDKRSTEFPSKKKRLTDKFGDRFPIQSVIEITVHSGEPILAPSYRLFPETTEEGQIASAMERYGVRPR